MLGTWGEGYPGGRVWGLSREVGIRGRLSRGRVSGEFDILGRIRVKVEEG